MHPVHVFLIHDRARFNHSWRRVALILAAVLLILGSHLKTQFQELGGRSPGGNWIDDVKRLSKTVSASVCKARVDDYDVGLSLPFHFGLPIPNRFVLIQSALALQ